MHNLSAALFNFELFSLSMVLFILTCLFLKISISLKKFIIYSIISAISMLLFLLLDNYILSLAILALFLPIIFKYIHDLNCKQVMLPMLFSCCIYQAISNIIDCIFYNLNLSNRLLNNNFYFLGIYSLITPIIIFSLILTIKNINRNNINLSSVNILSNLSYNSISITFLSLYLILANINVLNLVTQNVSITPIVTSLIYICSLMTTVILLLFIFYINTIFQNILINSKNATLLSDCDNLSNLNKDLRALKHDFLNHLQVLAGLLQLKKYSECFSYIMSIREFTDSSKNIKTGLISLNALFNTKQLRAKQKNIKLELDISSRLSTSSLNIQDWEITNILGNLIDNAMYEENKVSTLNKYIKVKIDENNHFYSFSVYNKNSYINSEKKKSIFNSGYTTKGNDGSGMGLYIIKNIVNKYNGTIDLNSNIGSGTQFSIYFPKNSNISSEVTESYPPQESFGTQNI